VIASLNDNLGVIFAYPLNGGTQKTFVPQDKTGNWENMFPNTPTITM
jgi:hypothetical protein